MKRWVRVFQHPDSLMVGHVRNLIEAAGIPCDIRNWALAGGMGDLAPIDCEPEIWVAPHNVARAGELIERWCRHEEDAEARAPWRCPTCDEWHDGPFDRCWRCGRDRF